MALPSPRPNSRPARTVPGTFSPNVTAKELERVRKDFMAVTKALRSTDVIDKLTQTARNLIHVRTLAGFDVRDQHFRPYSPMWACIRRKAGLPVDRVTLRFSGIMYGAIGRKIHGPRRASLFVRNWRGAGNSANRDLVADAHQHGRGVPKREWFGFSPKDRRALQDDAVALLTQTLLSTIRDSRPLGHDISTLAKRHVKVITGGPRNTYHRVPQWRKECSEGRAVR